MARLIYAMLTSLDGYTCDRNGDFSWAAPKEPDVLAYVNELGASIRTYLYGRRMYDTMVFWETADALPGMGDGDREWARAWKAAEKIVYSRSLTQARSARTRIEQRFDADALRRLKAEADHDMAVAGPELAGHAVRAGLVDEFQVIACPVVVGGGTRFFPDGVRLDLDLLESRSFKDGTVLLRYATRQPSPT